MPMRAQRTLRRAANVSGFGLFSGCDATLRFLPAPADSGIVFCRVDLPGAPEIPATLEFLESTDRRTSLVRDDARVELTEHVLAALAGLQIDNCRIEIDAAEVPGMDGSCCDFVEALLAAGSIELDRPRLRLEVDQQLCSSDDQSGATVCVKPFHGDGLAITYQLDYGPRNPIKPQVLTIEVTPDSFVREICEARTFVLESEVAELRRRGYGQRVTERDLLVFGPSGVIGNELRFDDECVRHKILDCIGDFALLGCDLVGHVSAWRSGHRLNQTLAARIAALTSDRESSSRDRAA